MKGLLLAIAVAAVLAIWTGGVRADDLLLSTSVAATAHAFVPR
ncbi:MAG: hypothetical protein AB1749_11260 [Pseudomonadota bacterium]